MATTLKGLMNFILMDLQIVIDMAKAHFNSHMEIYEQFLLLHTYSTNQWQVNILAQ